MNSLKILFKRNGSSTGVLAKSRGVLLKASLILSASGPFSIKNLMLRTFPLNTPKCNGVRFKLSVSYQYKQFEIKNKSHT